MPTITWWPKTIAPGGESIRYWYFGDMMATFAELAGVEPPEDIDSDSFAAALRGTDEEKQWKWDFDEHHDYAQRRPDLVKHAANLLDKLHTADPNWKVAPPRSK